MLVKRGVNCNTNSSAATLMNFQNHLFLKYSLATEISSAKAFWMMLSNFVLSATNSIIKLSILGSFCLH